MASLQCEFHIGWNHNPWMPKRSECHLQRRSKNWIQSTGESDKTALMFGVLWINVFSQCVCVSRCFIASLLIKYKGPDALLCWVRYCWGVIWLHSGPLPSKAAELCFICGSESAWPSLCTAWPFIWKKKKSSFGPCCFLLLCQSVCLPVSYCHRNRFSIRLCICLSLLSSLSSPCIFHPLLCHPSLPVHTSLQQHQSNTSV